MFLHFYINPSGRGKGKRGGVRVRVPVRGCCSDIFLTICISHTPWPGKRNENGGNDLLISEVCAHTYIHTNIRIVRICLCGGVIDRSKFELVWTVQGRGVRAGGEVWSMDWLWKWKRMHVTSACECIINIVYRTRHLPKIPLRHHIRLLFSVCTCVSVCACVCVCENLWRARKLCATYAKSLPKDLQKNQKKKTNLHAATVTLH